MGPILFKVQLTAHHVFEKVVAIDEKQKLKVISAFRSSVSIVMSNLAMGSSIVSKPPEGWHANADVFPAVI